MMDEERRRLEEAFAELRQERSRDEKCPPPALIWEAVRLEVPAAERRRLVEHIAVCGSCAAAWRLASEINESAPIPSQTEDQSGSFRRLALIGLAAAAILVLAVSLFQFSQFRRDGSGHLPEDLPKTADLPSQPPGFRESGGYSISSLLDQDEALPRAECLLKWKVEPAADGVEYQIRVMDESLQPIVANGRLSEAEFLVPVEKLAHLPSGSRIIWQLRADWPGGREQTATFSSLLK